ncbi:MAG: succinate dehydrogenase cytochrome b subunit [Chitinophagaceae bacterium]|jgi:succinate dehydrogenase / fumarate reductase cytochrome b subunit|nr:succinate dehydrogenase cytochrome b subunit [Chitinophagaceae bacterium]OQY92278.1 MAG: succinate dehydrogenase [Sphingobacteriales bacterium UTBCD1]
MKWSEIFTSAIGKKLVMGLSGLFLISFLVIHVGLNACIWANDGGVMFNKAAHFMDTSVVIRIIEVVLFAGFFIHIIQGIVLEIQNRSKRKTGYQVKLGNRGSKWNSRYMGLLGTIVFMFLIIHWKQFWIPSRFTGVNPVMIDGKEMQNMFNLMKVTFSELWVVIIYVVACYSLCWHLIHGFQSAFRTIGVYNSRYLSLINKTGIGFSVIVSLAFAMMPVSMYLNWV